LLQGKPRLIVYILLYIMFRKSSGWCPKTWLMNNVVKFIYFAIYIYV
jgi:hypothetical protein